MSHFTDGKNVTWVWLNGDGCEARVERMVLIEVHMYGIFDVPGCGAELEAEEKAALSGVCARDATEDMTGSAEGHGECVAELGFGGHGDSAGTL